MDGAVDTMLRERRLLADGHAVVGIDEVGRGALAGPLCVGAVVVEADGDPPDGLTDSKLLTAAQRSGLREPLDAWAADWALGWASAKEIDAWGVSTALAVAATRALAGLTRRPTHALVDGPRNLLSPPRGVTLGGTPPPDPLYDALPTTAVVRGDRACASIAAASVLAKVARDELMAALGDRWPGYRWAANKGYGTPEHLAALRRLGPSPHHRLSWRLPEPAGRSADGSL